MSTLEAMITAVWETATEHIEEMAADWVVGALTAVGSMISMAATLFIVMLGYRLVTGKDMHPGVGIQQLVLVCGVTAVVGPSLMYVDWVYDQAMDLPVKIAGLLSSTIGDSGSVPGALAATVEPIMELLSTSISGLDVEAALYATVLVIAAGFALIAAMGLLLIAKAGLAVMLSIGPFVILGLLYQPTRAIFDKWLGFVITLTLTGVFVLLLLSVAGAVAIELADTMADKGDIGGAQAAAAFAAMASMGVMYLFVGSMASTIGGGIAVTAGAGLASLPWASLKNVGVAGAKAGAVAAGGAMSAKVAGVAKEAYANSGLGIRHAAARQMAGEAASAAAATRGSRVGEEVTQQRMKAASRAAAKEARKWRLQNS